MNPTRLGIDEVVYEKGHSYLTAVRDIDHGKVIWIGHRRKKETLDAFFNELGAEKCARIEVCVLDIWDPYIASVHEYTHAEIVYDLFHVAKKITDAVDLFDERDKEIALKRLNTWFENVKKKAALPQFEPVVKTINHDLSRRHPELLQVSAYQWRCGK